MAVTETTIKRLFAKSHNRCAMPKCTTALVIGEHVVAEICHIRARRKGGARYDANLTATQKDEFKNLILLCGTCHTLIDKDRKTFTAELLEEIKAVHERGALVEISAESARQATLILSKHAAQAKRIISNSPASGTANASASRGGVAVSIGGHNQAPINIHTGSNRVGRGSAYPANSIGADANMTNYVEYLCELYVDYMAPIERDQQKLWTKLGKHIKNRFRLRKRTRSQLSSERFFDLVTYLVEEKLSNTPVGRKHVRNGTRLCRTFDEFRYASM